MTAEAPTAPGRLGHARRGDSDLVWFDGVVDEPPVEWFDAAWLLASGVTTGSAAGRGEVYFLELAGRSLVLRHYRRGGLLGDLLVDRYAWTGLRRSRAWRELTVQGRLYALGLPVAMPVGARVQRPGRLSPFYRADLLTQRLLGTSTLAEALTGAGLAQEAWRHIGATIADFHAAGFEHADLNAHNVLLDDAGGVHLIDFDQGRFRAGAGRWCGRNLVRLRRSLAKLHGERPGFGFYTAGWAALLAGYDCARRTSASRSASAAK